MGCQQSLPQQVDPTFVVQDGKTRQYYGGGKSVEGNNTVATTRSVRSSPSTSQRSLHKSSPMVTPLHINGGGTSTNSKRKVVIEGFPKSKSSSTMTNNNNGSRVQMSEGGTSISSSPALSLEVDEDVIYDLPELDTNGHLMPAEIVRRTSSSVMTSPISIGNKNKQGGKVIKMEYAYRSQRGYYPDEPLKPNQDKYGITLNFAGETGDATFAVFDGHGEKGHDVANFAKKKLPQALAKYVRQKRAQRYSETLQKNSNGKKKGAWNPKEWPLLSSNDYEDACKKAFREANKSIQDSAQISDRLSGTTAATVCFHGGRMTVCHVGDSRVVLGRRQDSTRRPLHMQETKEEEKCDEDEMLSREGRGLSDDREIVAIALTQDQTPYRSDERDRVIKAGGEIKTIAQMEGSAPVTDDWDDIAGQSTSADPPRVWASGKSWPGCAFTRSLGDSMAESIGVCSQPEIMTTNLTANDEFLVIASDGLFEFLTNQDVINICSACYDPLQACEMLTKASYDKWVEHDIRCDDITVIVCFLSSDFVPSADEVEDTTDSLPNPVQPLNEVHTKTEFTTQPPQNGHGKDVRVSEVYSHPSFMKDFAQMEDD